MIRCRGQRKELNFFRKLNTINFGFLIALIKDMKCLCGGCHSLILTSSAL